MSVALPPSSCAKLWTSTASQAVSKAGSIRHRPAQFHHAQHLDERSFTAFGSRNYRDATFKSFKSDSIGLAARHTSNSLSGLPETADVVIIGGGITGSALLYELAEFTGNQSVFRNIHVRKPQIFRVPYYWKGGMLSRKWRLDPTITLRLSIVEILRPITLPRKQLQFKDMHICSETLPPNFPQTNETSKSMFPQSIFSPFPRIYSFC